MNTRIATIAGSVALGLLAAGIFEATRHFPGQPAPDSSVGASGRADCGGDITVALRTANAGHGASVFSTCAACHSIGRGGPDVDGPNLYGVVGGPVGQRRTRFAYTAALRHAGGTWDPARLDAWLTDPKAFAPGTSMAFEGLPDRCDRADVIAYLATQGAAARRP